MKDLLSFSTRLTLSLLLWFTLAQAGAQEIPQAVQPAQFDRAAMGYVVVTPEGPLDGGDFGPYTPGTRTGGIQEAIDYARSLIPPRNVWISGAQDGQAMEAQYITYETIRVPRSQGFIIDGGYYVIRHRARSGAAIHVDSAMNCKYHLGLVCSNATAPGVILLRPEMLFPIDTWADCGLTVLDFRAEATLSSVQPGTVGLMIDAEKGHIYGNEIMVHEVASNGLGVKVQSHGKHPILNNKVKVTRNHGNLAQMEIGDEQTPTGNIVANQFEVEMASDGMTTATGLRLASGQDNLVTIFDSIGMAQRQDLIIGPKARQNHITAQRLDAGFTNEAEQPTNRLTLTDPAKLKVETPPVPATGQALMNRNPFTVEVTITQPGQVSVWSLTDSIGEKQDIAAPLIAGQQVRLAPGDSIQLTYDTPPAWRWRVAP